MLKAFFSAQANLKILLNAIVSETAPLLTSPSRGEDVDRLTTAKLRHCIRVVRKRSQPSYRMAKESAKAHVLSGNKANLSSESSTEAM